MHYLLQVIKLTFCMVLLLACEDRSKQRVLNLESAEIDAEAGIDSDNSVSEELESPAEVSVDEAILECLRVSQYVQNSPTYALNCSLKGVTNAEKAVATAKFSKTNMNGLSTALEDVLQVEKSLSWSINETPSTLFSTSLSMEITVNDKGPFSFEAEILAPLSIKVNPSLWIPGEPNNAGGLEHCAFFANNVQKANSERASGLPTTGPLGRLNDIACTASYLFLCRSNAEATGNKWQLSTAAAPFKDYRGSCPVGTQFGVPLNDAEFIEVAALIDSTANVIRNVWVALSDASKEAEWQVILK